MQAGSRREIPATTGLYPEAGRTGVAASTLGAIGSLTGPAAARPAITSAGRVRGASVMVLPATHTHLASALESLGPRTGFDYPATLRGSTTHFNVYYDPVMGVDGPIIADGVLANCEYDYNAVSSWFGGLAAGPFNVLIHPGIPGAYHYGCSATDLYCDAHISPDDPNWTNFLNVAEFVEVFEAVQGRGWDCGASNGEGLSRTLAETQYPSELDGFNAAATWLDGSRPDFVNVTDPTDTNYISIGCSVLFLFWLRYQLSFTWNQICQAAAPTLAQTYQNLTGRTDALAQFTSLLLAKYPQGSPSGLTTDNPYPLKKATNSGYLIQSIFGARGNFEMVIPMSSGGLAHFWRNNDDPALPWNGPFPFAAGLNVAGPVSLIQSSFGDPGNLEVLARAGDLLMHFWRDSGPAFAWNGPYTVASGIGGSPSLIQSRFGTQGNFECVVPMAGGGLAHFWRNNDDPALPWNGPFPFGASAGHFDYVALVESNFGYPGNLEVIARAGDQLLFFWRDSGPAFNWNGPWVIATGIVGNPCLFQSRFGNQGNFEMVVPLSSGGLGHFWRNNDDPALPWYGPFPFGTGAGVFTDAALIESDYGWPGNLEVNARIGGQIVAFWRDSGPAFNWNGPYTIVSGV
jgi:hypothetical protein